MKPFYTLPTEEVYKELDTTINGLSSQEAESRLEEYGPNALDESPKKSLIAKFFEQLKDVMIIMLLVAAGISAIIALIEKSYSELIDGGIILLIVIVNAIIGLVQENKAEHSLESLKNLNKPYAKVIRNGVLAKIKNEDIVPGDIVELEAGDIIPADLRLIESISLKVEEAALTGESVPSDKDTLIIDNVEAPLGDRNNMCYSSGIVKYGRGKGIVVATGMKTEVGKIAKMLQEDEVQPTPLQVQLTKTAKTLSIIVLVIAAIIFIATIIRGLQNEGGITLELISGAFMIAVAIAVAAIPEGLPAVVTIVLAIGVQKMSEKKAIVRNLPAVEALGCCDIICSDKTGTLTLNQMTVKELFVLDSGVYKAGEEKESLGHTNLIRAMVLCNDTKRSGGCLLGDPTETALVAYADTLGLSKVIEEYPRVDENPFDSNRKLMSTINKTPEGNVGFIKGAPDILVDKCNQILDGDKIREITSSDIQKIKDANHDMATKALRVLGFAIKVEGVERETLEENMVFVGLVGMIDPPRAEVKGAVETCGKAGMRAIMITGDHIDTARAIATEIGILFEGGLVVTGAELDALSDEEFENNLDKYCVFARVSPENKVRIVKAYKESGKKVAMTGDGVNDAPSIKSADIGIGMGITGTDVSKGVSDMVLADDNFATIVSAVSEGRKVYSNIQKAVQYLLSANIAEVLCLFIATVFLNQPFLTPVMILWVNLVTDSLPALALGTEKAEPDIMDYPPRKSDASLLAGSTGKNILIQGILQTILVMTSFSIGTYVLERSPGVEHNVAMTMAFITLCMIQLFHSYNMRSQKQSLFSSNIFGNKLLNIAFLVCSVLLFGVLLIPGVGPTLFDTAPSLTATEWGISLGLSVLIIPMVEIQKLIERMISKRKQKVVKG